MARVQYLYGQQATVLTLTHVQLMATFRVSIPSLLELSRATESVQFTTRGALQRLHPHLSATLLFSVR